ncbi:MAG: hypothetical protein Q9M91_08935 [Candidatus Dojkabacteria bacterium]|nr:hypothetical protein [Candidatus Dojkabacteria bacterium]MDQ7021897.1 hypothetical protein [Candidatus Dojkabacteria bacterium]
MKIITSAWPGSGGSTLVILLAYLLDYKVVQGSEMCRYIIRNLVLGDTGNTMVMGDHILQKHFVPIYNSFMTDFIKTGELDNIIIDTDLISFSSKKIDNIFSIFLHSSSEVRKKRFITDNRPEDIDVLEKREKELQKDYFKLYGVDFFSIEDLEKLYDLVLDNSTLSISEELKLVLNVLNIDSAVDLKQFEKDFWENGKNFHIEKLKSKNQFIPASFLFDTMKRKFRKEINNLPEKIKDIINSA